MADETRSPESIHGMATAAKEMVASATQWMIDLQSLPVEDAEAEYLHSMAEADDMVETMRTMQDEYYQSTASGDWVEAFLAEICDPFGVESTTSLLRQALTAPRWIGLTESSFVDTDSESVLQHCAHSPGFCLKSECLIGMSHWQHEMTFRTAFEAAPFFSDQVYHYLDRISGLSRIEELRDITTFQDVLTICRTEREDARRILRPCVCVEQLQAIINYEAAWLLHSFCGMPQPQRWAIPTPIQLFDTSPFIAAAHVIKSRPLRFGSWFQRFKAAKYSENESERAFRDWLKLQLGKTAFRDTRNGPICFDVAFLQQHGVKDSE